MYRAGEPTDTDEPNAFPTSLAPYAYSHLITVVGAGNPTPPTTHILTLPFARPRIYWGKFLSASNRCLLLNIVITHEQEKSYWAVPNPLTNVRRALVQIIIRLRSFCVNHFCSDLCIVTSKKTRANRCQSEQGTLPLLYRNRLDSALLQREIQERSLPFRTERSALICLSIYFRKLFFLGPSADHLVSRTASETPWAALGRGLRE